MYIEKVYRQLPLFLEQKIIEIYHFFFSQCLGWVVEYSEKLLCGI